jgi:hypothetical protein
MITHTHTHTHNIKNSTEALVVFSKEIYQEVNYEKKMKANWKIGNNGVYVSDNEDKRFKTYIYKYI